MNAVDTSGSHPKDHNNPPTLTEQLAEKYEELRKEVNDIAARANETPRTIEDSKQVEVIGTLIVDAKKLAKRVDAFRTDEKAPHLQAGRDVDAFFNNFHDRLTRIADTFQDIADDHARKVAAEERRKRAEEQRRIEEEQRRLEEEQERQREIAEREAERNRPKAAAKHEAKAESLADQSEELAERVEEAAAAVAAPAAELVERQTFSSGVKSRAKSEFAFEITDYQSIPLDKLRPYLKRAEVEKAIKSFIKVNEDKEPLPGVRIYEDVKAQFR